MGTDAEGFISHDEASYTRSELALNNPDARIRAWLEDEDGNMHLVLVHEMVYHDGHRGTVTDPRTGRLVSYVHNLRFKSIDLATGVLLRDVEEFYNDDDQLITGSRLDEENGLWYSYQFYDMPPEAISQVYEETVEALEAYIKNQKSD